MNKSESLGNQVFDLHLVSDSTGETIHSVARACLVQFDHRYEESQRKRGTNL